MLKSFGKLIMASVLCGLMFKTNCPVSNAGILGDGNLSDVADNAVDRLKKAVFISGRKDEVSLMIELVLKMYKSETSIDSDILQKIEKVRQISDGEYGTFISNFLILMANKRNESLTKDEEIEQLNLLSSTQQNTIESKEQEIQSLETLNSQIEQKLTELNETISTTLREKFSLEIGGNLIEKFEIIKENMNKILVTNYPDPESIKVDLSVFDFFSLVLLKDD